MAGKAKKTAKMAHNKAKVEDDVAASHLVILTGAGHKVAHTIDARAVCGAVRTGWRYGSAADVTCKWCASGEQEPDFEVPPGRFMTDEEMANLPVLDMGEFEAAQ